MKMQFRKRALLGGGVALLVATILVVTLAPHLGNNSARALAPADLNVIAKKNDSAASAAAANLRAQSERSAEAADALADAQDRGAAAADATIARFDNEEGGAPPPPAR
jgi:type II secretory pathway component PulM